MICSRVRLAFIARLQRDEERPLLRRAAAADRHGDAGDVGSACTILPSSSWCRIMSAKEMSWLASEVAGDQPGVLLRKEALGMTTNR